MCCSMSAPPKRLTPDLLPVALAVLLAEHGIRSEHGPQRLGAQRPAVLHEVEIDPGPARGDPPPRRDRIGRPAGLDAAPAGQVDAVPGELDPEVADGLRVVPAREHPGLENTGLLSCGVDFPGVAVEEERQKHVHGGRLAGAVDPSEQQPPAAECQDFVAVLVDVQDAGSIQHPPFAHPPRLKGRQDRLR